jgi:molybdenum cofactor synthesis domain-containing protein
MMRNSLRSIGYYTPVDEALSILLKHVKTVRKIEEIPVLDSVGRVSAETILAPRHIPAYDSSHMDGFAVRHTDLMEADKNPVKLKVVGTAKPGPRADIILGPGETVRILTGAFLPEGADSVVPQEEVTVEDGWVVFRRKISPGEYVDRRGFDISMGEEILSRGHIVRAADAVLLAHLGVWHVRVVKKPVVGLVAVGDELTDNPGQVVEGKIFNTHTHLVRHLLEASGCIPRYLGIMPDEVTSVGEVIGKSLEDLDMLITIAGSSVSEKDVASQVFSKLGAEIFVHGLKLQPGRVGGFAVLKGKPIVMLPGLIMSTINVFMFLAYPLVRFLQGLDPRFYHQRVRARIVEDVKFRKYIDFKKVVWVKLYDDGGDIICRPRPGESSGMSIPAKTDGFIVADPGVEIIPANSTVWVNLPPVSYNHKLPYL